MSRRVGPYYRDTLAHYTGQARHAAATALRWAADRVDPWPPATGGELRQRFAAAEAEGRARGDAVLAAMYADPAHPLRRAADADLRARAAHPSVWQPRPDPRVRLMPGLDRRPVVGQDEGQ